MLKSNTGELTVEQLAELEEMRAEYTTPAARAKEKKERLALKAEFPLGVPRLGDHFTLSLRNIRKAREGRGLKLREVAAKAGMQPTALSRLERGLSNPTLASLNRVLDVLDYHGQLTLVDARSPSAHKVPRGSTKTGGKTKKLTPKARPSKKKVH
jgi:ribosome-binding protein aMBF1 (putative translation factor)